NLDVQNHNDSNTGGASMASWSESNRDRRERLRHPALETIDLNKGPYDPTRASHVPYAG
uniref:Uncharacterized protein n=1 Tax=Anopheles funestus TaxID=62324 RepID=A0A7M4YEC1_ANOFN